jgi:predicted PurR-regulated permease PerM
MEKWLRLLVIIASFLGIFVLIACFVHLLGLIPHTLVLFSLGLLFAYAIDPLVEGLRNARVTRGGKIPSRELSVAVVMIALVAVIGGALWGLSGFLVKQVETLQRDYPRYHDQLLAKATDADAWLGLHHINFNVESSLQHPPPQLTALGERVGRQVLPVVGHFLGTMAESAIVLLIALYLLIYCREMREKFNAKLPDDLSVRANAWQDDVNRILGGFVRGQILIALVVGAAAAIGCLAIGIHLWLIIGLVVVAASLIPVFGPYIGIIPAVLAAVIGPTHFSPVVSAVAIVIWFVIINEVGSKVLYPKFVGEAMGLHAVLVLFVLFAGLELGGVLGVLFAAPLTALTGVTIVHLYRLWQDLPDAPMATRRSARVPVAVAIDDERKSDARS